MPLVFVLFSFALTGIWLVKKPTLSFGPFAFFFFLEQIAYQFGVIKGCFRCKNWRPFLIKLNT